MKKLLLFDELIRMNRKRIDYSIKVKREEVVNE